MKGMQLESRGVKAETHVVMWYYYIVQTAEKYIYVYTGIYASCLK